MKKCLFLITVVILSVSSVRAQKNKADFNWQKLAAITLDFKTNKNAVTLPAADNFKALQVRTADTPVHIDNLVVVYEGGNTENVPVRFDFKSNTESRDIPITNNKTKIKEVEIVCRAVSGSKSDNAQIEIWGAK